MKRNFWILGSLFLMMLGLLWFLPPVPVVHAATTFTVNSTTDAVDAAPGNGVCATAGGICTLRAAIMEANALAGADTIILPAGTYILTVGPAGDEDAARGDLDINETLTIIGASSLTTIVDGGALDRVFDIGRTGLASGSVRATLSNMTIRNGNSTSDGGGVIVDGQIVTITNSIVMSNTTATGGRDGGGVYNINQGQLTIINTTISNNTSINSRGGGVSNRGTMTITSSTVNSNTASSAVGIYNEGTLSMINSTVSGNIATSSGGGIRNLNGATLALTNVTISNNGASSGGGLDNLGSATLRNTIIANSASGLDCFATAPVTNGGNNIVEDNSCGFTGGSDPKLTALGNLGGLTPIHYLLSGSPAIDAGNNATCPATDQRGTARPVNGTCDIVAIEQTAPTAIEISNFSASVDVPNVLLSHAMAVVLIVIGMAIVGMIMLRK